MYPSLNPLTLRREKANEVFRLIKLIKANNNFANNGETVQNNGIVRRDVTGKRGTGGWI